MRIPSGGYCSSRERVIRLELDHGPDYDAGRREGFFEQAELSQEIGFDSFASLVTWPQSIAERLDDVIRCNGDVRAASRFSVMGRCLRRGRCNGRTSPKHPARFSEHQHDAARALTGFIRGGFDVFVQEFNELSPADAVDADKRNVIRQKYGIRML
jgi:hypothetical protein